MLGYATQGEIRRSGARRPPRQDSSQSALGLRITATRSREPEAPGGALDGHHLTVRGGSHRRKTVTPKFFCDWLDTFSRAPLTEVISEQDTAHTWALPREATGAIKP